MEKDRVVAYLRAYRVDEDTVKIGRVLTLEHGKGIGTILMNYAVRVIPEKMPCKKITVSAQKHAVPFYMRQGFVTTSGEYLEENIVHKDMYLEL